MTEDYIKTGKFSEREISAVLKEAEQYKKNVSSAKLTNSQKNGYEDESIRKSDVYFPLSTEAYRTFNIIQSVIIEQYANKNLNVANISEVQFVHYPLGGKFNWHQDIVQQEYNNRKRGLTFSMNLSNSDDYEGGNLILSLSKETTMNLNRERGSYIIFPSFIRHKVDEVTRGSRDAVVAWSYLTMSEIDSMR